MCLIHCEKYESNNELTFVKRNNKKEREGEKIRKERRKRNK
jgi:hypothetical protein